MITISGLPSIDQLHRFVRKGGTDLLNVSGTGLYSLYGVGVLNRLALYEYRFPDVFSGDRCTNTLNQLQSQSYCAAVRTLTTLLKYRHSVHVFCHRGIGRSPAVSCAAFIELGYQPNFALQQVRSLAGQTTINDQTMEMAVALLKSSRH